MEQENQIFPATGNVRAKQLAQFLSIGISTFHSWVQQGKIKQPIKYGSRVSVWQAEYIRSIAENGFSEED